MNIKFIALLLFVFCNSRASNKDEEILKLKDFKVENNAAQPPYPTLFLHLINKISAWEKRVEDDGSLATRPIGDVLSCAKEIANAFVEDGVSVEGSSFFIDEVFKNCIADESEMKDETENKSTKRTVIEILALIIVVLIISCMRGTRL